MKSAGNDGQDRDPVPEEDAGRANIYALIGRLFYEAPDSILLAQLSGAEAGPAGDDAPLERSWRALQEACRSAYPVVVRQEYDSLFVGVGKSEITPYTSKYVRGISPDQHVVRLRAYLDAMGLGRRNAAFEVEDHISGICDVMRSLILGGRSLPDQSLYFREFIYPPAVEFCDAVARATSAGYYCYVAAFAREFFEVERLAFEMHDAEA